MNKRRKLIIALGAGALVAPFCSFGQQQGKVWRIGFLSPYASNNDRLFEAFKLQLRDLGYVEGKTITIDYLSSEGKFDRLPTLAADLVRRNVDVIVVAGGTIAATAAKSATNTIPVVFTGVADPVGQGFVASLAHPGANVTGTSSQNLEVAVKLLALLKEIVPSAKRVAILTNSTNSALSKMVQEMKAGARTLRIEITVVIAKAPTEFEGAFTEIVRNRSAGLVILADALFNREAGRLTTLAAQHRLPTIGGNSAVPENGGLMSYGANRPDLMRHNAVMVDKIIKGAKPADLPVEQPTKFELVINGKTAKALGLKIPQSLLVMADKVIE